MDYIREFGYVEAGTQTETDKPRPKANNNKREDLIRNTKICYILKWEKGFYGYHWLLYLIDFVSLKMEARVASLNSQDVDFRYENEILMKVNFNILRSRTKHRNTGVQEI